VTAHTIAWQGSVVTHHGYPSALELDATAGLIGTLLLPRRGSLRLPKTGDAAIAAGVSDRS
jgi:hypothetical protein